MNELSKEPLDITEKGRAKDGTSISLDRRLYVQFLAFGGVDDLNSIVQSFNESGIEGVLYLDINDPLGIGVVAMNEDPDFFIGEFREFLNTDPFSDLRLKEEFTMLGRTYSLGYENDLEKTLISGPRNKILDEELKWAIWYPLRRVKSFENLPQEEQRAILGEHGKVGFQFGKAGYAKDIRLASFGLDKNDNDFVIGVLGKELYPLSAVIQRMRKTKQTSTYLESLGPFFVGKAIVRNMVPERS